MDKIRLLTVIALLVVPAVLTAYLPGTYSKNALEYPYYTTTYTYTATSTQVCDLQHPCCLIATAAFGSMLAPEVQLLRGFRDNSLLKTRAGWSFMMLFNAWYYSFSPQVAGQIAIHPAEGIITRFFLYPLVGIIELASFTFNAASVFPEMAVLLSGLVGCSLIGAFYVGLPLSLLKAKVLTLRNRRLRRRFETSLSAAMLASLTVGIFGELWPSTLALMVASWTMAISTMLLSASIVSSKITDRFVLPNRPSE